MNQVAKYFIFYVLCLLTSFPSMSFEEKTDRSLNEKLILYIDNLEFHGIHQIGSLKPVTTQEIKSQIENTKFVVLASEDFERQMGKTRRSAFYSTLNGFNYVFINEDHQLSERLLLHEVLRDKHYEISNAIAAMHLVLNDKQFPTNKELLVGILLDSAGTQVDRYGISAVSPHKWLAPSVENNDNYNSVMTIMGLGGDITGGGGDGGAFDFKSLLLLNVLNRLIPLYKNEIGLQNQALLQKLSNLHFFLSTKIYVETNYVTTKQDDIEYFFGTDAIERILFFPYLIQVPPGPYTSAIIDQAAQVVLQSDLFREVPSLQIRYNSPCYCNRNGIEEKLSFLCPDPTKAHIALHELMDFYKNTTEREFGCKLRIGDN